MGINSLLAPRIFWNTSFADVIDFGYPIDNVIYGDELRDGSEQTQGPSGIEDAWTVGIDYLLEGDFRYIPNVDTLDGGKKLTGWDGAKGVHAFLTWMRDKNQARFVADARNMLLNPRLAGDSNADGVTDLWTSETSNAPRSSWLKGAAGFQLDAQGLTLSGATVLGDYTGVFQRQPGVMPTEVLTASADLGFVAGPTNAQGQIHIGFFDAGLSFITSVSNGFAAPTGSFARFSVTATAPANTAYAEVHVRLAATANNGVGTLYTKNVMLRRANSDTTFIDNGYTTCTLVEPMKGRPTPEKDGTKLLHMILRTTDGPTSWSGY